MSDVPKRVLLVDDEPSILRAYARALSAYGWVVESASNGKEAIECLRANRFGVIVSDVSMPEMGGLEFLHAVREHDLDVPVILMTGGPQLDSAIRAVEFGAFRYLLKPIEVPVLEEAIRRAFQLHCMARLKREALDVVGVEQRRLGDRAGLEARFSMALRLLWIAYQPIVSLGSRSVFGYEGLLRTGERSLPSPGDVLDAAERLGRLPDLGRAIRERVAIDAASAPAGASLFVNLHAQDLGDDDLYAADSGLARVAARVVLEITERASLDGVRNVVTRVKKLREMGFRIALDDLGAGYAGLTSYSQLEPEIVKIDLCLVRGIDSAPRKQSVVRSMKQLCDELGSLVVAEGVETAAERDTLADMGFDLLQGYLFARPSRGFPVPAYGGTPADAPRVDPIGLEAR